MTEMLCDCILIHFKVSEFCDVMTVVLLITEVLSWHEAQRESFVSTGVARDFMESYEDSTDRLWRLETEKFHEVSYMFAFWGIPGVNYIEKAWHELTKVEATKQLGNGGHQESSAKVTHPPSVV